MLKKARAFAIQHHGKQQYGDQPYVHHLDAVASILEPYGETAQVIGYLHDVVEDTPVTTQDVAALFTPFIAQAVSILTDQPGDSRQERKQKTYARMATVSGELELALIVKAADRLANLHACLANNHPDRLRMYLSEHEAFTQAVYRPGLCEDLWVEIKQHVRSG